RLRGEDLPRRRRRGRRRPGRAAGADAGRLPDARRRRRLGRAAAPRERADGDPDRPHQRLQRGPRPRRAPRRPVAAAARRRQPAARPRQVAGATGMTQRPAGLEAIILYKLIKAALETLLGLLAVYMIARGAEAGAATLAEVLLEHFTGGWALEA